MLNLKIYKPSPKIADESISNLCNHYYELKSREKLAQLSFQQRMDLAHGLTQDLKQRNLYHYRMESDRTLHVSNDKAILKNIKYDQAVNLASNNYLDFTMHPEIAHSSSKVMINQGVGSGSVPMLSGTFSVHKDLELKLAKFTGYEAALTFNSCFAANYGLLTSFLADTDVAILDTYVHASIVEGCLHTNQSYFMHNDSESLGMALKKVSSYKNKLVIVDGVYSMDGDIAKLKDIIKMAHKNGAMVLVDESHALGVIGSKGKGTRSYWNIEEKPDLITCSMGKALGGIGGFVAGSKELISLMELTSRPFIYSTSLPPHVVAGLAKAIDLLEQNDPALNMLWTNIKYFKDHMKINWEGVEKTESAIFPLIIKDEVKLLQMCTNLKKKGVFVVPVFYPVVPRRKSRIRISLTAGLTKLNLDYAIDKLNQCGKELRII